MQRARYRLRVQTHISYLEYSSSIIFGRRRLELSYSRTYSKKKYLVQGHYLRTQFHFCVLRRLWGNLIPKSSILTFLPSIETVGQQETVMSTLTHFSWWQMKKLSFWKLWEYMGSMWRLYWIGTMNLNLKIKLIKN